MSASASRPCTARTGTSPSRSRTGRVRRRDPVPPPGDRGERAHDRPPGPVLAAVPSEPRPPSRRRSPRSSARGTSGPARCSCPAALRGRTSSPAGARRRCRGLAPGRAVGGGVHPEARSACRAPTGRSATCAACRLRHTVPDRRARRRADPEVAFERNNDWLLEVAQSAASRSAPLRSGTAPGDGPGGTSDFVERPRHGSHGRHRRSRRRTPRHGPVTQAREYRAGSGQGRSGHQALSGARGEA